MTAWVRVLNGLLVGKAWVMLSVVCGWALVIAGGSGCKKDPQGVAPAPTNSATGHATQNGAQPVDQPGVSPPVGSVNIPGCPDLPADWKPRIQETVAGDRYEAKVDSPWGPMVVTGGVTGADGVATRYWTAFSTGDFRAVFPYATGDMKERLRGSDTEAGHKDYFDGINMRLEKNPMTEITVQPLTVEADGRAIGLVLSKRKDGTEERREIELVQTPEGWRYKRIQLQR